MVPISQKSNSAGTLTQMPLVTPRSKGAASLWEGTVKEEEDTSVELT